MSRADQTAFSGKSDDDQESSRRPTADRGVTREASRSDSPPETLDLSRTLESSDTLAPWTFDHEEARRFDAEPVSIEPPFSSFDSAETPVRDSSPASGPDSPRSAVLRKGQVVGRGYCVEHLSERCLSGVATRVRDRNGHRLLIKHLPPDLAGEPKTRARFLHGARASIRLQDQHTLRVFDAGSLEDGCPYLVSELPDGPALPELLRVRGPLAVGDAVDLALQVLQSLAEAHLHGLVHGHLNPRTILVGRNADGTPRIRVMDYGVAEFFSVDPFSASYAGIKFTDRSSIAHFWDAASYKAPEQVRRAKLDPRTDVWALGALLQEMLSGAPAFRAENVPSLIAKIVADPPTPLAALRADIPSGLERLVLRCLEKDARCRHASVAELALGLRPFASPARYASVDRITATWLLSRTQIAHLPLTSVAPDAGPMGLSGAPVDAKPSSATDKSVKRSVSPRNASSSRHGLWTSGLVVATALAGCVLAGSLLTHAETREGPESTIPPVRLAPPAANAARAPSGPTRELIEPPLKPPPPRPNASVGTAECKPIQLEALPACADKTPQMAAPERAAPAKRRRMSVGERYGL